MHPHYAVGLGLAALAAALWLVAVMAGAPDLWSLLGLITILVGFAVAAGSARSRQAEWVAAGLAAVAVGIVLFYRGDLWSGLYNVAGALFAIGVVVAAAGAWRRAVLPQRTGLAMAAFASLVWTYADLGSWGWLPGNALMVVACATAAWGVGRPRPA